MTRRSRLTERRKALGLTQESLAELIGTDRTTVGRWERAETEPYPYARLKLCQALAVTADELDDLLRPDDPPADRVVGAPDMYRRQLLRLLSVAGALTAVPPVAGDGRPMTSGLGPYAELNTHLWQVFGLAKTKQLAYPLVHEQLGVLLAELDSPQSSAARQKLCVLVCDLLQLAGEIFFDADRYTEAAECYSLAASAGREARSYDRWACALTRHAFVHLYDHEFAEAAVMLDAAGAVARRGDSQLPTSYWVSAVQAQAFAGMGDADSCDRALDAAARVVDLTDPAGPGGWLRFDGTRLGEERGACYLALGQNDRAEAALTGALKSSPSLRRKGSILTDLALLGVRRRDADHVLEHAGVALELAEQTHSTGYLGRKLQGLRAQLGPMRTDDRIAVLDHRISRVERIESGS
ncbi:helix-turn-helix transcriptional regulator [Actinoplanes sp. NPDC023936]|uniref:helix-turn-helix transcriptional regulator n=1 Tax=Actinoplanes sp. NPDC023936 TaxID=3154910 RepID=UPI0033F2B1DE